jgi:hypothetical protein
MNDAAKQALEELQASILFRADFPKRVCMTGKAWAVLSHKQRYPLRRPSLEAMEKARPDCRHLECLVSTLGKCRYEPATATLIQLWRECALVTVRMKAGYALYEMGTPEAWMALKALLDDSDDLSRVLAIKATFAMDGAQAYDVLKPRFDAPDRDDPVPYEVLSFLKPWSYSDSGPTWHDGAQDVLARDQRWPELCAGLRRHEHLGWVARQVLRYATPAMRDAAPAHARAVEAQSYRPTPVRTHRDGMLLKRYTAGAFEPVWRELRSHPHIDGDFREEALEVATATMRRVAYNADLLADRLRARGWKAFMAEHTDLRTPPSPGDEVTFARIAETTGAPIPPSLLAFWKTVGGINWVWDYETDFDAPDLGLSFPLDDMDPPGDFTLVEMDPLCVDPPVGYPHKGWASQKLEPDRDLVEPFEIVLAADYLHKADVSGGPPYTIHIPFLGADPLVQDERHRLPFVDYLRLAFAWAGFPGLEDYAERGDVQNFVAEFGRDLMPF